MGHVVFLEGQKRRIIQFDEMGFHFDGSKNGVAGRPAAFATNPDIGDPQQQTNKSSQKITCVYGINYEHEPLPPMFVLSTTADQPRVQSRLIRFMRHIKGQFGHPPPSDPDDIKTYGAA